MWKFFSSNVSGYLWYVRCSFQCQLFLCRWCVRFSFWSQLIFVWLVCYLFGWCLSFSLCCCFSPGPCRWAHCDRTVEHHRWVPGCSHRCWRGDASGRNLLTFTYSGSLTFSLTRIKVNHGSLLVTRYAEVKKVPSEIEAGAGVKSRSEPCTFKTAVSTSSGHQMEPLV